jgi:hypothetical protein
LISGCFVTVTEEGELKLWPALPANRCNFSTKIDADVDLAPIMGGDGAVIVGDDWVHLLTRTGSTFWTISRPLNGTIVQKTMRATPNTARVALKFGEHTGDHSASKVGFKRRGAARPPAGKTWSDVLNARKQRLDVTINNEGKTSSASDN